MTGDGRRTLPISRDVYQPNNKKTTQAANYHDAVVVGAAGVRVGTAGGTIVTGCGLGTNQGDQKEHAKGVGQFHLGVCPDEAVWRVVGFVICRDERSQEPKKKKKVREL